MVIHEKSDKRGTLKPHEVEGWCVVTFKDHYQCYKTYVTTTKSERIFEIIELLSDKARFPFISTAEKLIRAAQVLTEALKHSATEVSYE